MKKLLALLLALLTLTALVACGDTGTTGNETGDTGSTESTENTENSGNTKTEYTIGETWTVDGQWSLTVTGVEETDYRNEYADTTPAVVYIVSFTYTNIGYVDESGLMDGLYFSLDETIVDSAGIMGYSYPGEYTYPQETPVGATCKAQACIGVDNAGKFKLTVVHYDGNENKQTATFVIEP